MYRRHKLLKQPNNSRQILWRYLKYERLMEIVNDGISYFPHITKFSDRWEGLLTEKAKESLFRQQFLTYKDAEKARASVQQYEEHKDAFYVQCWHMNNHESYLMWKVYADRGCAIQTNYERLVASFGDKPPEIDGCVITYIDYEKDQFPIGNIFLPVSHKDLPYKDEKEFRLLYWKTGLTNQNYPSDEHGVKIKVDADMMIDCIYINPSKKLDLDKLRAALENKRIGCEIRHSRIKTNEIV
jgi:hypothetical protein